MTICLKTLVIYSFMHKISMLVIFLFIISIVSGIFAYDISGRVVGERDMLVNSEVVKEVDAQDGTVIWLGQVILVVPAGTYVSMGGKTLQYYTLTLALTSGPGFAIEVDNQTNASFHGKMSPFLVVFAPDTWSTEAMSFSSFNGSFLGVKAGQLMKWMYGDGVMFSNASPGLFKFVFSGSPFGRPPKTVSYPVTPVFGLTPVNGVTYEINGTQGGVTVDGNLIVIVQPGTYQRFSNGTVMKDYNFSLVYYSPYSISTLPFPDQYPFLVFAYAVNGQVTYNETANKPYITVILSPSRGGEMWDWGPVNNHYGYVIDPHILSGEGIDQGVVVNLNFKRPVPWVFTLPLDS